MKPQINMAMLRHVKDLTQKNITVKQITIEKKIKLMKRKQEKRNNK